jgi:hypothetical protein
MTPLSQLDPALVSNIILGTVPIGGAVLAFLLHLEHRLTKIETILQLVGLCGPKAEKGQNGRS